MKRTLQTSVLASALCGLVLSTSAVMAQPQRGGRGGRQPMQAPAEHMMRMFDEADTDQDGTLTREEFQAAIERQMAGQQNLQHRGMQQRGRQGFGGPQAMQGPGGSPGGNQGHAMHGGPQGPGRGPMGHGGSSMGRGGPQGFHPGGPEGFGPPPPYGAIPEGDEPVAPHSGHMGPPPAPQQGAVIPQHLVDQLSLTEEQKEKLAALRKELEEQLSALLTEEQREQLEHMHAHEGRPEIGEGRPPRDRERGGDRSNRNSRPDR